MSEDSRPLLSVREEARRTVAPDSALIHATAQATGATKATATTELAEIQGRLTAQLAILSGVALTPQTLRSPLTWSMHGVRTNAEHDFDKTTGQHGPTGRMQAELSLHIGVRDFTLLDRLSIVLAGFEPLSLNMTGWHVDADNPAWPELRAEAIAAAVVKARHYAAALGGTLVSVEHIADLGLLGGEGRASGTFGRMSAGFPASGPAVDTPSLDPVPQELLAVIEARFLAGGIRLAE